MKKFWKHSSALLLLAFMPLVPVAASADTISVSQIVTITATVAPARSIVVNDQGQMTKIYSNTSENVAPKVYVNKAPGKELTMTPQLQVQYNSIMAKPGSKVGVAIDVPLPVAREVKGPLHNVLSVGVSIITKPSFFRW